jgi:uncharacterized protein
MQEISLSANNQTISARIYTPADNPKKLALLFLHGWRGRPNYRAAEFMAKKGYPAMAIIMRGHPGSQGDIRAVTAADSLADAVVAYDFLKKHVPDGTAIAAIGNSYGSYIAVLLSEQRELAAVSLRVPAAYPDDIYDLPKWGKGHDDPVVDAWRKQPIHFSDNRALRLLHDFVGDIQIIEAEDDDIVPARTVKNYVEAVADHTRLEYLLMKSWPHSLGDHPKRNEAFRSLLLDWANKVESRL